VNRGTALFLTVALAAGFVYVAIRMFGIQLAEGDVYPEYSSLRSDPEGAKLLFDSLALIKDVRVERNYLPLEYLPERGAAILLLGTAVGSLDDDLMLLERAAARGNRVVVALQLPPGSGTPGAKGLEVEWHVKLERDSAKGHVHRFYFSEYKDWRVLDRVGTKVLTLEKDFGKGTIALFVESDDFNNQSTVAGDRLRPVLTAIGDHRYIVFDEQHLGIAQGGSVMEMARRFRLSGLVLGLLLVAAACLWRNASGFPPQAAVNPSERMTGRTSQAGLLGLLHRHIPPRELLAACWQEWLNGNRGQVSADRLERAAEIVRRDADRPMEAARGIAAVLHAKGEL
jgi:hypothetical protein